MRYMAHEQFLEIVDRELANKATEAEKSYLWSHPLIIERWRAVLVEKVQTAHSHIFSLKNQMLVEQQRLQVLNESDEQANRKWLSFKLEMEVRINRNLSFIHFAQMRLSRIKNWQREQEILTREEGQAHE